MPDSPNIGATMKEVGRTGLSAQSGQIQEDYLVNLRGARGVRIFTEMRDSDGIVSGSLLAIEMQIRSATWHMEPFSSDPQDIQRADRLDGARNDMSTSWEEFISEAVSFLQFGWAYHEVCYKFCNGTDADPTSKFNDGLVGWRKLPIRSQDTLDRWEIDDNGGIQGMWQEVASGQKVLIPIDKSLLLRTTSRKNNPEGRSLLRSAFRPWYYKHRIEEHRAIGIERDLVGLPLFGVPARILSPDAGGVDLAIREAFQEIGENIRNNEQAYLMYPLAYDANGHEQYKVGLMGSPGTKQINVEPVIQQYSREIAQAILTDVLMMGHEKVGTQALATTKDDMLNLAMQSWAESIADAWNRHVMPKVIALNGWPADRPPKLCVGKIGRVTLQELGNLIEQLSRAGYPLFPDGAMEKWIADQAGFPYDAEARAAAADLQDEEDDDLEEDDLDPEAPDGDPVPPTS